MLIKNSTHCMIPACTGDLMNDFDSVVAVGVDDDGDGGDDDDDVM